MSVTSVVRPAAFFTGDGASKNINFTFKVRDESELVVLEIDPADLANPTTMVLTTDYTVSINEALETGTVTLVAVSDATKISLVYRSSPQNQTYEAPDSEGKKKLAQIEAGLDQLTLVAQEVYDMARRAIKFQRASQEIDHDIDDLVAERLVIVNATGDGLEMSELTYDELLETLEALEAAAAASAQAAANSEAAAAGSEAAAANSATAAAASATAAAASAAAAAVSEASALLTVPSVDTVETISEGGEVSHDDRYRQHRTVIGDPGGVTTSNTPFGTDPANFTNGMIVTMIGTDDDDYVDVPAVDTQYGVLNKEGTKRLQRGVLYHLIYNSELERFIGNASI